MLPDGRCDIILRYHAHRPDAVIPIITGPATQAYTVEYEAGDCWLGVRMRPDNGDALWGRDVTDAADTVLRGPEALTRLPELAALNTRTLTVSDLAAVVPSLTMCRANQRTRRALTMLHTSGGRMKVEKLAAFVGCTTRQLHRIFRHSNGLSVKTYAQLVQFHRTLRLIRQEQLSISAAAFEGGYADHAHLTRAFRRFGGFAPSDMPKALALPKLFP